MNEAFGSPYFENPQAWEANSSYHLVDNFIKADVALLFDTGVDDAVGAVPDGRQFHEALTNRFIAHTYHEYPGAHTWQYWGDHIGEHINFHLKNFSDRKEEKEIKTGQIGPDDKWAKRYMNKTLEFEAENKKIWSQPDAKRPLVLLGSSSVEHMALYKDFDNYLIANRGISADGIGTGSRGILHRLYCSAIDCNPKAVLILNGRNNLGGTVRNGTPRMEDIVATYQEVVKRIQKDIPDAYILICACPPTSLKYENMAPLIIQYDEELKKFAATDDESGDMIKFIDTWTPFADEGGLLMKKYTSDGLHLNKDGHKDLVPIITKVLDSIGIQPE